MEEKVSASISSPSWEKGWLWKDRKRREERKRNLYTKKEGFQDIVNVPPWMGWIEAGDRKDWSEKLNEETNREKLLFYTRNRPTSVLPLKKGPFFQDLSLSFFHSFDFLVVVSSFSCWLASWAESNGIGLRERDECMHMHGWRKEEKKERETSRDKEGPTERDVDCAWPHIRFSDILSQNVSISGRVYSSSRSATPTNSSLLDSPPVYLSVAFFVPLEAWKEGGSIDGEGLPIYVGFLVLRRYRSIELRLSHGGWRDTTPMISLRQNDNEKDRSKIDG